MSIIKFAEEPISKYRNHIGINQVSEVIDTFDRVFERWRWKNHPH